MTWSAGAYLPDANGTDAVAAYRIVVLQIVAVLVTASVMSLIGAAQAEAALWAGAVCVPPTALFAWTSSRTRQATRLLGQGVGKMLGTVALMAVVFAYVKPTALGFFAAFAAALAAYVIAPLVWRSDGSAGGTG